MAEVVSFIMRTQRDTLNGIKITITNNTMIEVTAAIILDWAKVLIARRWPWKHLAWFWEFPWWKLESWEEFNECLKREVKEELGIEIEVGEFFMNNKHVYWTKEISLTAFKCKIVSWNLALHDHDQIEWVDLKDLNKFDFAPADIPFINKLTL